MATVVSTLYPPLIETFMPAFPYEGPALVTFSFSSYNNMNNIRKVHISLVNQRTNDSAFKNNSSTIDERYNITILNNVWITDFSSLGTEYLVVDTKNNTCTVKIPSVLLKGDVQNFVIDNYYKVQIRFDASPNIPTNTSYFIENRQFFSEWSSVCLIKAIPNIQLGMTGFDPEFIDIEDLTNISSQVRVVQRGIVPISGSIISIFKNEITTKNAESLQRFRISIMNSDYSETLDSTNDWVYTTNNENPNRIYWLADITNALQEEIYNVVIDCITQNQYSFSKTYQLKIANYDALEFTPQWTFKKVILNDYGEQSDAKIFTEEDGKVYFNILSKEDLPKGFLYVKRASSLDNFKNWELLSCVKNIGVLNKNFVDSTVGSLIKYKYACQYRLAKNNAFTETKYAGSENDVYPDFYDILISRKDRQLAIRYNGQISSYAPVVNRQVINTLGGKYPKFAENAQMNYKKITLTGLISAEADYNREFLNDRDYADSMQDYDKYMDGRYEVRNDTLPDDTYTYTGISSKDYPDTKTATEYLTKNTSHDLMPKDNWWLEREFREQAIEWLNDGEPKLLRSMTEGNLAVIITDISLTPNTQVGRRSYNISMTAYEIGDGYSLQTLSSLGIIDIPDDYSENINSGIATDSEDIEDEDAVIISTLGQLYQQRAYDSGERQLISGIRNLSSSTATVDSYTVAETYNGLFYKGALKAYKANENSFILKDLRIQFESKPQWYNVTGNNQITRQDVGDNLSLGYKLGLLTTASPTKVNIFIEEKGYYQIPSNIEVLDVFLYDGAIATLDYKLKYKQIFDESYIPSYAEISQRIVGQISGKWTFGQSISENIKNKYEYYRISNDAQGYEGLLEKRYLDKITAVGFDGTSYAMIDIIFEDEEEPTTYVVGQTGVYNLMTDYPIKEATFVGRRMFRKDNPDYINDEKNNVYTLDSSTQGYQPAPIDNFNWIDLDTEQQVLDVLIVINNNISTPTSNQIVRKLIEEDAYPYESINAISNPKVNTIYGVYNEENDIVLKLYTVYNTWVDVELLNSGDLVIMGITYMTETIKTKKKKFFLEEWEFSLDSSAEYDENKTLLHWYKAFLGKTETEVRINESTNLGQYLLNITTDNIIPEIDGYSSIKDIQEPEYNIIYGFNVGENQPKTYKIYYIDEQWYDIEFIDAERTLISAKVPVYGMVNYRGDLVRISYE